MINDNTFHRKFLLKDIIVRHTERSLFLPHAESRHEKRLERSPKYNYKKMNLGWLEVGRQDYLLHPYFFLFIPLISYSLLFLPFIGI